MPLGMDRLTPEQHQRMRDVANVQLIGRFRVAAVAGMVVAVLLVVVAHYTHPAAPLWARVGAPAGAFLICVGGLVATFTQFFANRIGLMTVSAVGMPLVACIGAMAAYTGGFYSPVAGAVFVIWVSGAVVFPLPLRLFVLGFFLQITTIVTIIQVLSPDPGTPWLYLTVASGVGSMCILGGRLRET